jgi:hypothetical protein
MKIVPERKDIMPNIIMGIKPRNTTAHEVDECRAEKNCSWK